MRFICDVCPSTAAEGHTVIIGNYEKWIRHLLSPQHQTEQNLVMARTSYWPQASWIALVKDLPAYDESNTELYVDVLMSLSEYGFVEALYYGNKTKDSICVALQWYEAKLVPPYLIGCGNDAKYAVKLVPRVPTNKLNDASRIGKKRVQFDSTSSTLSGTASTSKAFRNVAVATSPITIQYGHDHSYESPAATALRRNNHEGGRQEPQKRRIMYDRQTLLQFCKETAMPSRFVDILEFPKEIIEEKAKTIDPMELDQFRNVKWMTVPNPGSMNVNRRNNGYGMAGDDMTRNGRNIFAKTPWNQNIQNGWCNNGNSRWGTQGGIKEMSNSRVEEF